MGARATESDSSSDVESMELFNGPYDIRYMHLYDQHDDPSSSEEEESDNEDVYVCSIDKCMVNTELASLFICMQELLRRASTVTANTATSEADSLHGHSIHIANYIFASLLVFTVLIAVVYCHIICRSYMHR